MLILLSYTISFSCFRFESKYFITSECIRKISNHFAMSSFYLKTQQCQSVLDVAKMNAGSQIFRAFGFTTFFSVASKR